MTEQEKEHRLVVTRAVWHPTDGEERVLFYAFFEEEMSTWPVLYGSPRKNGEGMNCCSASGRSSPIVMKCLRDTIAVIHLPKDLELELAQSAFRVILHVLAGYSPDEFCGVPQYRQFGRRIGRIFKQKWDEGRIPVKIHTSSVMALQLQDTLVKRPSCVF